MENIGVNNSILLIQCDFCKLKKSILIYQNSICYLYLFTIYYKIYPVSWVGRGGAIYVACLRHG